MLDAGRLEWMRLHPEEVVRHVARGDYETFARYLNPKLEMTDFHRSYYRVLDAFAKGVIRRLIVQAPPQHGKSQGSSRGLPEFMLGLNPDLRIVIGSYNATMARSFNRDVQRAMMTPEYRSLFPETRINDGKSRAYSSYACSADQTDMVDRKGSLKVRGRGGALTGATVDVAILDDVYKDFREANSPVVREAAWNWYTSVVRTRLHKGSQELIVFTRWHEDDIIGRIEKSGEKVVAVTSFAELSSVPEGAWVLVNWPAIKVGDPTELDPRAEGEPLWPSHHPIAELEERRRLDPNQFECLYQGDPGSAESRLYHPFRTYVNREEWGRCIRKGAYIDVADGGDDFLAAVTYDVFLSPNRIRNEKTGRYEPYLVALVTDIIYTQDDTDVTYVTVPDMLNLNGTQQAWVESNAGGAQFEKGISPKTKARTVPFHQGGNKESRIISNAAEVNQRIIFPIGWEGRWPAAADHLQRFLRHFRGNTHDDIEDCLTGIYEKDLAPGKTTRYGRRRGGVRVINR